VGGIKLCGRHCCRSGLKGIFGVPVVKLSLIFGVVTDLLDGDGSVFLRRGRGGVGERFRGREVSWYLPGFRLANAGVQGPRDGVVCCLPYRFLWSGH